MQQPREGDSSALTLSDGARSSRRRFADGLHVADRLRSMTVKRLFLVLIIVTILSFLASLTLGRYPVSLGDLLLVFGRKLGLWQGALPENVNPVILHVRLPRILAAMMIGAGLAVSGAAYQGMFRNPLVSPDILGASAGAGFGAALGIMLSQGVVVTQLLAMTFSLGAVILTYVLAGRVRRGDPTLFLVLAGILVGTVFSSLIATLKFLADPTGKLPAITFWLMGSLTAIKPRDLIVLFIPMLVGGGALLAVRWHLNPLSFGEEEAKTLGSDTRKLRAIIIVGCTLMTASAVSVGGIIGWVGLVIPHVARGLIGPHHGRLLPASALMGAVFLLLVEDLARSAGTSELPLGILTALIGAPFFFLLLVRTRRAWT